MFIMSQDEDLTVNSTTLSSINIEKISFIDDKLQKQYPDAHKVVAYGKGEKSYLLGIYGSKVSAEYALRRLHIAMDENMKTFRF